MRKTISFAIMSLLLSSSIYGQTATPKTKLTWTQDDDTLALAQSYRYELELDNLLQRTPLVVTCSGSVKPYVCEAIIPAITTTKHKVRIRPVDISETTLRYGQWSDAFTFTMTSGVPPVVKATPKTPMNLRLTES